MKQRRFQRKVKKEEHAEALPAKDLVVLIPLFGSSLAISWEVGRFHPIPGFHLFTLSEHLLAAIQALPVALVFSAFFGFTIIPLLRLLDRVQHIQSRSKQLVSAAIVSTVVGVVGWYIFTGLDRDILFLLCTVLTMAIAVTNALWFRQPWSSPVILFLFGGVSIVMAIALGRNYSLGVLHSLKNGEKVHPLATIISKSDTSKGYVLMTGERGLLVYFPDDNRLSFQKADEIQKVEWQFNG